MKTLTVFAALFISTLSSCISTSDALSHLIFGNRKSSHDRRADRYEDRGFSKKKASRLAAEDEFWSRAKSSETPEQSARWENPVYPD